METNWILKDHKKLTSKQVMGLYILMKASGIKLCIAHIGQHMPFEGAAMSAKKGDYISYVHNLDTHIYDNCREISYDELISMLEQEIKLKK